MPKYEKTVQAFLAEEGSLWGVVDALAEDMPGHCSAGALGECQQYLAEHGIDKQVTTIKEYRIVGRFLEEATHDQRRLFRSQSVTTIRVFVNSGASQESAAAAIHRYQRDSGQRRMPKATAAGLFGTQAAPGSPASTDPEDWTPAQWEAFDRKVVESTKTILTALNVWQRGLYTPSVEALAQLSLLKPADVDAEFAALLSEG